MSLLLDALKQAEENKKKITNEVETSCIDFETTDVEPLVLEEPAEVHTTASDTVPSEVANDKSERVEESIQPERPVPGVIQETEIESPRITEGVALDPALNVFAAGGARKSSKSNKHHLVGIVLFVLTLSLLAMYWQTNESPSVSAVEEDFIVDGDEEVEVVKESIPATFKKPIIKVYETEVTQIKSTQENAGLTESMSAVVDAPSGITIKKSRLNATLSSRLSKGYIALQRGRYAEAQNIYERVLQKRPKQTDALLGLANIYAQNGNLLKARRQYDDVLTIEPANKIAQLGLLYTYQSDNSAKGLQLLQGLSAKYPGNSDILVAIGHKLAKQSKWSEAQKSYFKAYSAQPNNALLAYNLAVSLDRMEKYSTAINFYKKALTLNSSTSPVINSGEVKRRLNDLGRSYE